MAALLCTAPLDVVDKLQRLDRLLDLAHRREARLHVGDHDRATRLAVTIVAEPEPAAVWMCAPKPSRGARQAPRSGHALVHKIGYHTITC